MSNIPVEKIQQAFDLFMSLRKINMSDMESETTYHFEVSEKAVMFSAFRWPTSKVVRHAAVWEFEDGGDIDEMIDMIEEELDEQRSSRKEQSYGGIVCGSL